MQGQVAIKQFWAQAGLDFQSALSCVETQLANLDSKPTNIRIISAGECSMFTSSIILDFCQKLAATAPTQFISAACTSVNAAILDFYHSNESDCVIIALELDRNRQQDCLDALDIGISRIEDGLDVKPSCGLLQLTRCDKQQNSSAYYIQDCQILSQQAGMRGTTNLVKRLSHYIEQSEGQKVSFAISSKWGLSVLAGVNAKLSANSNKGQAWLASAEQGQSHYLSVKPILELQSYHEQLNHSPLLIITLGGGGRVGLLKLNCTSDEKSQNTTILPQSSFENHDINQDIDNFNTAIHIKNNNANNSNLEDSYQLIRTTLKYPRSRYRGLDNHYFKWSLTAANNTKIGPHHD